MASSTATQGAKAGKVKVIKGAKLIDGKGGPALMKPVIVIEGKRIKAVGKQGEGKVPAGAEVIAAGNFTGSHLDLTLPRAALRQEGFTADGPWALRAPAREHMRAGADLLKTSVSGGGGTQDEEPDVRNMTQEELEAIVDEGHAFHKPTSAHCFTAEAHTMCVRAKGDTIEHMVLHDKESIAMIKASGIPVTPTLSHRTDHAIEVRARIGTPRTVLDKMKKIQPYTFETFKVMHQAGIKIAMGTDLGPEPEIGTNAKELELYVDLGMTPMEALQTATRNAAEAMGV